MAGLMDGEGSFSIGTTYETGKPHYMVHIRFYNTNRSLINWVKLHFGGNFRWVSPQETNIAIKTGVRPMGQWWLTGRKSIETFLLAVLPYLVAKHEQANIILQYVRMNGKHDPAARQKLADRIKLLNDSSDTPTTNTQDNLPNCRVLEGLHVPADLKELKIESELMGDHESALLVTAEA